MTLKIYTLVAFSNGGMNPMEDRETFTDRNIAMRALMLSNDKSALMMEGAEKGEISGWRKMEGKIGVFSIQGHPELNLILLCGPSILTPLTEENEGVQVKISTDRIYKTLQNLVQGLDQAQHLMESQRIQQDLSGEALPSSPKSTKRM